MSDNPAISIDKEKRVLDFLGSHGIAVDICRHPPVYTCEEAEALVPDLPGRSTKNLFLRDRSGHRHFLVVTDPDMRVDLRALAESLDVSRLMFASPDRLKRLLGIDPGSVSMLALMHDTEGKVECIVDENIWGSDVFKCHPMVNTATLLIAKDGLERFLNETGHRARVLELPRRLES